MSHTRTPPSLNLGQNATMTVEQTAAEEAPIQAAHYNLFVGGCSLSSKAETDGVTSSSCSQEPGNYVLLHTLP